MKKNLQDSYVLTKLETKYGDKGSVHSYIPVYEKYLSTLPDNCTLLELGVGYGESLLMWQHYFPQADVTGVQIAPNALLTEVSERHNLNVIYESATSAKIPYLVGNKKFDVIIDDASHKIADQLISFANLSRLVKEGGFYFIEDIEDIDKSRASLEALHPSCTIYDNRHLKGRSDDVIAVYQL